MSWLILLFSLISFLITMNRVAGKKYLAEIATENEIVKGEDFKLNRYRNLNRYRKRSRNMNRYRNRYKKGNRNRDRNRNRIMIR